jgi:hypothetical protein
VTDVALASNNKSSIVLSSNNNTAVLTSSNKTRVAVLTVLAPIEITVVVIMDDAMVTMDSVAVLMEGVT